MRVPWHKWIRKAHRWLGILIGIQFLAWTVGGLYFSWTDLDTVHGSDRLGPPPSPGDEFQSASIDTILTRLREQTDFSLDRVELLPLGRNRAVYRIAFRDGRGQQGTRLADASSGELRGPLSLAECQDLAVFRYNGPDGTVVASTRLLEAAGPHDEYRELPLPAYAFTFDDLRATTIYVAPAHARVTSIRNNQWRVFDFLWMLHTMDYESRDNFNNRLLQVFALFGLATILSGFALFFVSARWSRG